MKITTQTSHQIQQLTTMTRTAETGETKTNPVNPTIQLLKDGTARLLFEWTPEPGPPKRPLAIRYAINRRNEIAVRGGAMLGYNRIDPCLLFLLVRRGDLISLGEKSIGESTATWRHYRVNRRFRLTEIDITGRSLTNAEIRSLARHAAPLEQPSGCDNSLREFLADPEHPAWLTPILEQHKQKWRTTRISKFYRLVPSETYPGELKRIVKLAPGAALRFFFDKLTKGQVNRCIRRDLETAVVHAFEHMSPAHLQLACREYPVLLLHQHGPNLPTNILLRCVRFEPFESFVIRHRFPPPVHARILAATCDLPFNLFNCGNISGLPAEIETSFRQFPVAWVESYGSDFSMLFRALERQAKITVNHELMGFLMERLPAQHLPKLCQFIANRL